LSKWLELDELCHALLLSNRPACQASMDQGHGLLRVALAWSKEDQPELHATLKRVQKQLVHIHLAPLFGILTARLGIENPRDACRILQYSMARDVLSAAVRLNVVGPLASLQILHRAQRVAIPVHHTLDQASSSAPLLEVLHPCHDLLAVRLFRT